MSLTDLTTDRPVPFTYHLSRAILVWNALERGWQAVVLGLALTACVIVGLQIPW